MCGELLFGAVLVLWGLSKIIETLFHVSIPIFGILFGILLIYLGIYFISGSFGAGKHAKIKYSCRFQTCPTGSWSSTSLGSSRIILDDESIISPDMQRNYKVVFGKSTIDMRSVSVEKIRTMATPLILSIDTIFGKAEIKLNKDVPVRIYTRCILGNTSLPDMTSIFFGSHTYNSHSNKQPLLIIYVLTVMGSTDVRVEFEN